jgi:putative ABC transport system permease protein
MMKRLIFVVLGSCLYRFVISIALRLNVPTEAFKLVSAVIVAIAIAAPRAKELISFRVKQREEIRLRQEMKRGGSRNV